MPIEWLHILSAERPLATYQELKEMSCGDVYNLLEIQSGLKLRDAIADDIEKNRPKER